MCILALCNLDLIKKLTLKFKKHLCCCSNDKAKAKELLADLVKFKEKLDSELRLLQAEFDKFKSDLPRYREMRYSI